MTNTGLVNRIAFFDCFSGAAGDMLVGACLDAGAGAEHLREQLGKLDLPQINLRIEKITKKGIAATAFVPEIPHEHEHRHLKTVCAVIEKAGLSERVTTQATAIFRRLAEAEATVHGCAVEKVHFHEVGAADAILDIVGACVALEALGAERVYCSALTVGSGTVQCAHGEMPVPTPATAELIKGIEIMPCAVRDELLTPTGAAILTTLAKSFGAMPRLRVERIGYGAGQRDHDGLANVLRLMVGEAVEETSSGDEIDVLEANIDDCSGELLAALCAALLTAGALDATCTATLMKKGRVGTQVTALCRPMDTSAIEKVFLREGTTFGVRRHRCQRTILARRHETVETAYGVIRMKVGTLDGETMTVAAEFEDCAAAARKHGVPVKDVFQAAGAGYHRQAGEKGCS